MLTTPPINAKGVFWFDDGKTPNVADVLDQAPSVAMHRLEFAAQVLEILAGERPPRLVDPPAWSAFVIRFKTVFGEAAQR